MYEVTKWANIVPVSYEILHDPWFNPAYGVDIADDPLGDYNKLITLYRVDADRKHIPVKTVLYPYRAGDDIKIGKDDGSTFHMGWPIFTKNYYVEINGKRIIEVPGIDMLPPPVQRPAVPRLDRIKWKLRHTPRRIADNIAARLGYQPQCNCGDDY